MDQGDVEMRNFSKSRLISMLQCPRRFWLELYRPDLKNDTSQTELKFRTGNQVGEIARTLFDPEGTGHLIDLKSEGLDQALAKSKVLLSGDEPIFEAGWTGGGVLAFADVMLPEPRKGGWHMIEVKARKQEIRQQLLKYCHLDTYSMVRIWQIFTS